MFGIFNRKKKPETALDKLIIALYGNPPPKAQRANLDQAVSLAFNNLLGGCVPIEIVRKHAHELFVGQIPYTTHDLALSTAIFFYKQAEYLSILDKVQLTARFEALQWFQNGELHQEFLRNFENDLYEFYKS